MYEGKCRSDQSHTFLKPGTTLLYIPGGRKGRKDSKTTYGKVLMIYKEVFDKEVIQLLEEGKLFSTLQLYVYGNAHPKRIV